VRIGVATRQDIAEEIVRWEIATAIAGAILGVNPFDQPDVESSKVAARELTAEYERAGKLPPESPFFRQDGIKLYADTDNMGELVKVVKLRLPPAPTAPSLSLADYLRAHLDRLYRGDYFALLAFLEMNAENQAALGRIRERVRDARHVATCAGFGPRYLHSTGQAYKGGPPTGVFLQITADDTADVPIPGRGFTFGLVKAAQARGDLDVLAERRRRVLRVHLGADVDQGLARLEAAIEEALR